MSLVSCSAETGLRGGDFWVTVFHEYASRSGPVRDAVEETMNWWMRWLEELVTTGILLRQLTPCDPAQIAFEIQALLGASSHQHRLRHDPEAASRGKTAILHRLETLRAQHFPVLAESSRATTAIGNRPHGAGLVAQVTDDVAAVTPG